MTILHRCRTALRGSLRRVARGIQPDPERSTPAVRSWRTRPGLELLEARLAPSSSRLLMGPLADLRASGEEFQPRIVAGDPNGDPPDTPADRIDDNDTDSLYAGVGSIQVNARRGTYIGTGTALDAYHILTAAHVVDLNNDGKSNTKDGINSAYFILNISSTPVYFPVLKITIHPNFTGFNRPAVNDDLAVLTLATPLPSAAVKYQLPTSDLAPGTEITMVGYGQSGTGVDGYTVGASFTVKRTGENVVDAFMAQDDSGVAPANEVFRFDFDAPDGSDGPMGGPSLGNDREATLGGGDSGGPSFVGDVIVGVNTFTQAFFGPYFGTLAGGINVFPYVEWIEAVRTGTDGGGDGGGGKPGKGNAKGTSAIGDAEATSDVAPGDILPGVPPTIVLRTDATLVQDVAARVAVTLLAIAPPPAPVALPPIASAPLATPRLQSIQQIGVLVGSQQEREQLAVMEAPNGQAARRQAAAPASEPERPQAEAEVLALPILEAVFAEEADSQPSQDLFIDSAAADTLDAPALVQASALTGFIVLLGGMRAPWGTRSRQGGTPVASVRPKRQI